MKKIVEVNYVGIDEFYKLTELSVKLKERGYDVSIRLTNSDNDFLVEFVVKTDGENIEKLIDEWILFDDPEKAADEKTRNYREYVELLKRINAILDGDKEDVIIYPQWRKAEGE